MNLRFYTGIVLILLSGCTVQQPSVKTLPSKESERQAIIQEKLTALPSPAPLVRSEEAYIKDSSETTSAVQAVPTASLSLVEESKPPFKIQKPIVDKEQTASIVSSVTKSSLQSSNLSDYIVELLADQMLYIPGDPAEMRVWIGQKQYTPQRPQGMVGASSVLPILGQTAKVKPFSTGLIITPDRSICTRIVPSGTLVRFKITPQHSGRFDVGADIELFDSIDCSGAAIPKSAQTISVIVQVNKQAYVKKAGYEILEKTGSALLDFWAALLGVVFLGLVLIFRKKLFNHWGVKPDDA